MNYSMLFAIAMRAMDAENAQVPSVQVLNDSEFATVYCGHPECRVGPIGAFWRADAPESIRVRGRFVSDSPRFAGLVLHEMVHYLQWRQGSTPDSYTDCTPWRELELEALDIQTNYLEAHYVPTAHLAQARLMYLNSCPQMPAVQK